MVLQVVVRDDVTQEVAGVTVIAVANDVSELMERDAVVTPARIARREPAGPHDRGVGRKRHACGDCIGVDQEPTGWRISARQRAVVLMGTVEPAPDGALVRLARCGEQQPTQVALRNVVARAARVDRPVVDAPEVLEMDSGGVAQGHADEVGVFAVGRRQRERAVGVGEAAIVDPADPLHREPVVAAAPQLQLDAAEWLDGPAVVALPLPPVDGPRGLSRNGERGQAERGEGNDEISVHCVIMQW